MGLLNKYLEVGVLQRYINVMFLNFIIILNITFVVLLYKLNIKAVSGNTDTVKDMAIYYSVAPSFFLLQCLSAFSLMLFVLKAVWSFRVKV